MSKHRTEIQWLDTQQHVPLSTLAELSGLSAEELRLLTDYGVLECSAPGSMDPQYRAECVTVARMAFRLRHDLDLGLEGLALVVDLLQRMRRLEAELGDLRARFPGGFLSG
ncbi:MAG TPA: chaperone modulator CbpM [Gammaproteobacteria bacterium]|nr:chaperone modulator CbpM [Gammaproteobacteria bacterium]